MAASAVAAAVSSYGIKTLLANGLSTFPSNSNPVISNGFKILSRNPPNRPVQCN